LDPENPATFGTPVVPLGGKHPQRDAERALLRAKALELRIHAYPVADIAKALHISTGNVETYIQQAIAAIETPRAEEWRKLVAMRLEYQYRLAIQKATAPLLDPNVQLKALAEARQINESQRRLLGLDAAKQINIDASVIELSEADRELAELVRERKAKNAAERAAQGLKEPFGGTGGES
jgi:hypothetical protein